jgi:hypothetical protein
LLHFPSKNTAAHTADRSDMARLHQLLDHDVWAFSNCRVDAPGLPVAEVDWLFYNSTKGSFILSEWKHFPLPVSQVRDVGEPWVLSSGANAANPLEQVARQLDAVRRVLRADVVDQHFPSADRLAVAAYQTVYCPQVVETTQRERLRYGRVHGTLEELARTVERRTVMTPLTADSGKARLDLAETLAALLRCSVSNAVRRKICPPEPAPLAPARRAAEIHRALAALHLELATLLDAPASPPPPTPEPAQSTQPAARCVSTAPRISTTEAAAGPATREVVPLAKKFSGGGQLKHHVLKHVPASTARSEHVRAAFLAALQDEQLFISGVHVASSALSWASTSRAGQSSRVSLQVVCRSGASYKPRPPESEPSRIPPTPP